MPELCVVCSHEVRAGTEFVSVEGENKVHSDCASAYVPVGKPKAVKKSEPVAKPPVAKAVAKKKKKGK